MRKVAIVGSEEKYWTPEQRIKVIREIKHIFNDEAVSITRDYRSLVLVSGGCPKGGVDIWAEIVADVLGIEKDIKSPEIDQWNDFNQKASGGEGWGRPEVHKKGYKTRNMEIAEACDVLYCIDAKGRRKSGGQWTMKRAKEMGKEVHLIEF